MTLRILGDYWGDDLTWQTIDKSHIPTERYYSGLTNPFEDDTNDRGREDLMIEKYLPNQRNGLLQPNWRYATAEHFVPPPFEYKAPIIVNAEPEYNVSIEDLPEEKAKNDIEVDMNPPKPPIMDVLRQYLDDKTTQVREDTGYRDKESVIKTLKNLGMYLPSDNKLPVAELITQARDRALKRGVDPDEYISLKDANGNAVTTAMDLVGNKVRDGLDDKVKDGINNSGLPNELTDIKDMIRNEILAKMQGTAGTTTNQQVVQDGNISRLQELQQRTGDLMTPEKPKTKPKTQPQRQPTDEGRTLGDERSWFALVRASKDKDEPLKASQAHRRLAKLVDEFTSDSSTKSKGELKAPSTLYNYLRNEKKKREATASGAGASAST